MLPPPHVRFPVSHGCFPEPRWKLLQTMWGSDPGGEEEAGCSRPRGSWDASEVKSPFCEED